MEWNGILYMTFFELEWKAPSQQSRTRPLEIEPTMVDQCCCSDDMSYNKLLPWLWFYDPYGLVFQIMQYILYTICWLDILAPALYRISFSSLLSSVIIGIKVLSKLGMPLTFTVKPYKEKNNLKPIIDSAQSSNTWLDCPSSGLLAEHPELGLEARRWRHLLGWAQVGLYCTELPGSGIFHHDGQLVRHEVLQDRKSSFPNINNFTGSIYIFNNISKTSKKDEIIEINRTKKKTKQKQLMMIKTASHRTSSHGRTIISGALAWRCTRIRWVTPLLGWRSLKRPSK